MVKAIEGIIAPLVTPFDEAGRLDAARAKGEIRRLLDAGVDGISRAAAPERARPSPTASWRSSSASSARRIRRFR